MKKEIILGILFLVAVALDCFAGSATSKVVKQTQMTYEECINKIYFSTDSLYKVTNAEIVNRKKNQVVLKHTSRAGTSHYKAEESQKINKQEAVFETKMTQPIDGTLTQQITTIKVRNVKDKAEVTVSMQANVDHFLASQNAVKKQLDEDIQNILHQIETGN